MAEVTIYDIAREAGVSPATVSRVLTGRARVSNGKLAAVETLIKKYDFRPNALASGLRTSTKIIGLMTADIRNPFYSGLAVECEKAANERGYTVLLCNIFSDNALEDAHLEMLSAQRAEAIIQIGCRVDALVPDPEYVAHINRIARNIPFIVSGKFDEADCFSLRIDHKEAMKMVIEHLFSLGHRDIALLGGSRTAQPTYEKRQQYINMLGNYGLRLRDEYIEEGDYSEGGGYEGMKRLLECKQRPTAVIAINDSNAVGALRAAYDDGLSMPDDMSIISFDNTYLSEVVRPKLTSMDYNYPEYGKTLIDIAIRAANGNAPERVQFITPRLIIRDSCAICTKN
jgi:DNA-binding LacI/PurR family transcriptional regulator